jgi:hypothetical protein
MIKNVKDIRDEWCDNGKLSAQSIKDLIWHIENDPLPDRSISLVTDARLMELVPLIAKHLDHEDDYVRELAVGRIVNGLELAEYAEKAFKMATTDPDEGVCNLAIFSLGAVMNKVKPVLKKQIAQYLYSIIISEEYDSLDKRSAFDSILKAMEVSVPERISTPYDPNHELVKKFKEKYEI